MPRPRKDDRSGFVLMARDLAIFASLSAAYYLSAECLEWLHFPQWRERYLHWQHEQVDGDSSRYRASAAVYRRLRLLTDAKYIRRVVRPTMLALDTYQREADLFWLTEKGAQALVDYRGYELADLHYGEPRQRSYLMLQHHVAVGRVYAALRSKIESRDDLRFEDWRSEHDFQREYDRIPVRFPQPDGSSHVEETGIQPDGAFFIGHEGGRSLLFIEVERDQPLKKWREKVFAYEAYHGSQQLRARFDTGTFIFLGIGLDAQHQQRLLHATGEALALLYPDPAKRTTAQERYLIGYMGMVHPLTIGDGWGELRAVQVVERGGAVPWGVKIESGTYQLIR